MQHWVFGCLLGFLFVLGCLFVWTVVAAYADEPPSARKCGENLRGQSMEKDTQKQELKRLRRENAELRTELAKYAHLINSSKTPHQPPSSGPIPQREATA